MTSILTVGLSLIFALTHFSGCAATANSQTLEVSVKGFNENLRWKRFAGAATFVPTKDRTKFIEHFSQLEKDLFIQSLEIRNVHVEARKTTGSSTEPISSAKVLVVAEYYILPSTVVKRHSLTQEWEFRGGIWQIVASSFDFANKH